MQESSASSAGRCFAPMSFFVDRFSVNFAKNSGSASSRSGIVDNYPVIVCRDNRENPRPSRSRLDEVLQFRTALSFGAARETRVQGYARDKQAYQQIFVQFAMHTAWYCIVYQRDFCRIRKPE
ncbi:unnamed protein product [Lasius platythorax]|uniref:Uncharacterized protein n=1 Tax=Lasius platythorax TaxID=488582 RepID=A0AAV2NXS3_9HYME